MKVPYAYSRRERSGMGTAFMSCTLAAGYALSFTIRLCMYIVERMWR